MATAFASLKLTSAKKTSQITPIQARRNKLCGRIAEQISLAKAKVDGTVFVAHRMRTVKDADGVRQTVQQTKRVKAWWFDVDGGKLALNVRYGARVLPLNSKNMTAIEIGSIKELVNVLTTVKEAVEGGELDAAMDAASGALRKGFGK